ncbi:hypothetical protein A2851_03180 [Candidatus Kaiserbacteria bacterium RIFCSPHIGHO2_01_FULL_53_29]|uniref:Uncharacterized protein n=1 Tax=Candidatus Kaiserbacteria bacterium RIFCSPHIGHO2_01_FULL_53_29 TaxID=1798480 RepID=A0A1F6CV97_9BACT|nr:MAG: hypothetical protein A2851_03180 [Candidatus Kaiserbacteria bacterium RIFCSPHIGHO2_01_FULL_53_29]
MKSDDFEVRVCGITPDHQGPLRDSLKNVFADAKIGMPLVRYVNNGPETRLGLANGVCAWLMEVPEGTTATQAEQLINAAFASAAQPRPNIYIGGL